MHGDVMLFPERLPFLERPLADVAHEPKANSHIDVDIDPPHRPGDAAALFRVTQGPAAEGQIAVCRARDSEIPRIAAELIRGVRYCARAHTGNMPCLVKVARTVRGLSK